MRLLTPVSILMLAFSVQLNAGDWSIGVTACPAMTIPNSSLSLPTPKDRFNYSVGVLGIYDLSSSLYGKVAIQFTRKSVLLAKNVPDTRSSIDPVTGRIDISKIVYGEATQTYESLTIPLTLNYGFARTSDLDLILSAGFEAGYLFRSKTMIDPTTTGKSVTTNSEDEFLASVVMGIGVRYSLSEDWILLLIPTYSYSIYPDRNFGTLNFHTISFDCAVLFRL